MVTRCSYCGRETELHEAGVPTCTVCADWLRATKTGEVRSVHSRVIQDPRGSDRRAPVRYRILQPSNVEYPERHTPP